ncbi:hypothetical protein MNBD_GAMMA12-522 [hydrothermal vent metagenome]|uniref:DUF4400 domain-containing protein n=1 Tax=hydrothermal vent metagenome TaxID=652676 RepID=A0A3B0YG35_9ZZZZ
MRLLLICILLSIGQISVSILMVTPAYTKQQITLEIESIQAEFGAKFASKVTWRANNWLDFLDLTNSSVAILSKSTANSSAKLNQMRISAYRYPDNFQFGIYQFLLRVALLSYWLPVLAAIFLLFILEGIVQRHRRKSRFNYSTVERNRIAIRILAGAIILTSTLIFSLIAIPAISLLLACLGLAVTLMVVITNSKRSL